ncbi:S8 family serine peptidase [Glycomyces sp. A-F 0318]|uniref:S8 family peptidase n=1 Tax=Glycomyces amatae TaxID=2881355 RepID=UPI001E36EAF1|nr:S8 family serine peptidase [Glycomyces amatae]MCD0445487.1 S8 family serine peptidase [Glycomyces amatae]
MATPLTPPLSRPPQAASGRSARAAMGAGFVALAATAAIAAAPGTALAQDTTLNEDNAWAVEQVQAPAAWETTKGEGITVAVMDTGINDHPFFEDKDVLPGYSVLSDHEDAWNDVDGHGSAVAAAVLLVAPEATILPVWLDSGDNALNGGMGESEFEAFRWAVDNGADVLVVPWGISGAGFDGEYLEVLQYAIDKGAIVVASAGNDPDEEVRYPGFVPGVVTVTGTNQNGDIWFENTTTGQEVVLAAPADLMTAPVPQFGTLGDGTELYTEVYGGTSMGSGFTGGVAALTWAAHPELDASNVIQRMIQTAGDGSGNRDGEAGYGLVNAEQAVNAEGIEAVEENPLGYPMGEAGASGVSPDEETPSAAPGTDAESAGPSTAAAGQKESNLSAIIVIAAAVVLVAAAIIVWLVLRGRGRKTADAQPAPFGPGNGPRQTEYQQAAPSTQQYGAPPGGGQHYGGPPPGPQGYSSPPAGQGFNQPGAPGEPSPPWQPSDPNRR